MKKANLCVSVCFIALILTGCEIPFGQYKPTQLELLKKTDPVEDYQRLETLFKKYGGNLASPEDTVVNWKDTQLYRIYEFKYHTVAVFPFNWNDKYFDIYLVAGHFNNYNNLLDDVTLTFNDDEKRGYLSNESFMFIHNSKHSIEKIGMDNLFLSLQYNDIPKVKGIEYYCGGLDKKLNDIITRHKSKQIAVDYDGLLCSTHRINFSIGFFDGKALWIRFMTPNTPLLTDYSINHYKLKIVTEGEFRLPIPEQKVPSEKK